MGSDDGNKQWTGRRRFMTGVFCGCRGWRFLAALPSPPTPPGVNAKQQHGARMIVAVSLILLLLLVSCAFVRILPPPELIFTDTFVRPPRQQPPHGLASRCLDTAFQLDAAQTAVQQQQQYNEDALTVVFACHRKWCGGLGHCEPCAGVGDRTRFLLSQIHDMVHFRRSPNNTTTNNNNNKKIKVRILIDAPSNGLSILRSAVYTDPSGWWGELLRYRSYDVTQRIPLAHGSLLLSKTPQPFGARPASLYYSSKAAASSSSSSDHVVYSHFLPNHFAVHDYDACLFHALFQPNPKLQAVLDRHNAAMGENSIGIHYRTGDQSAFGLTNADNRLAAVDDTSSSSLSALLAGWNKMQRCALALARQLFPVKFNSSNTTTATTTNTSITFYLATDNPQIKAHVRKLLAKRQHHQQQQQQQHEYPEEPEDSLLLPNVYLTDVEPGSYLRGNQGDRDAWMELFLLATRKGLVANILPTNYTGTASRRSQFAELARKIGFMEANQYKDCSLDD